MLTPKENSRRIRSNHDPIFGQDDFRESIGAIDFGKSGRDDFGQEKVKRPDGRDGGFRRAVVDEGLQPFLGERGGPCPREKSRSARARRSRAYSE